LEIKSWRLKTMSSRPFEISWKFEFVEENGLLEEIFCFEGSAAQWNRWLIVDESKLTWRKQTLSSFVMKERGNDERIYKWCFAACSNVNKV
jgi:hypothetical protein